MTTVEPAAAVDVGPAVEPRRGPGRPPGSAGPDRPGRSPGTAPGRTTTRPCAPAGSGRQVQDQVDQAVMDERGGDRAPDLAVRAARARSGRRSGGSSAARIEPPNGSTPTGTRPWTAISGDEDDDPRARRGRSWPGLSRIPASGAQRARHSWRCRRVDRGQEVSQGERAPTGAGPSGGRTSRRRARGRGPRSPAGRPGGPRSCSRRARGSPRSRQGSGRTEDPDAEHPEARLPVVEPLARPSPRSRRGDSARSGSRSSRST